MQPTQGTFLGITPARYLYNKRNVEKVWGAHYTLGARYLSKNTVIDTLNTPEDLNHHRHCCDVRSHSTFLLYVDNL